MMRPRRRRWPLVVAVVVVVLAALAVAADLVARSVTEDRLASAVKRSTHAAAVTVDIRSFPFLYDVAARGTLKEIRLTGRDVPAGHLVLQQVTLDASGVRLDRHVLLYDRQVQVTSVARATATAVVRLSSLEQAVVSDLHVGLVAGAPGQLVITVDGRAASVIDLTKIAVIPPCPLQVGHTGDVYTVSCTVSPVPASVLAALSKG